MARKRKRQLAQNEIDEDRRFLEYLHTLPDYVPPSLDLNIESLTALEAELLESEDAERRALKDLETLRAKRDESSKALYDALFGGTLQNVIKGKSHNAA